MGCCTNPKTRKFFATYGLMLATATAVVIGIALGVLMRQANLSQLDIQYFSFPGDLLLRMLKMVIIPLVICSIITGVASVDRSISGKLGARAVVYYMSTTFVAVVIGIVLVVAINPGRAGKDGNIPNSDVKSVEVVDSLTDLLRNLFPENLIQACFQQYETVRVPVYENRNVSVTSTVNGTTTTTTTLEEVVVDYVLKGTYVSGMNVLGLICFSLVFGVIIGNMGEQGENLVSFFSSLNEAIMRIVTVIIWYAPIGIMFLIAGQVMKMEDPVQVLERLGLYMATVIAGLVIHGFVVLPTLFFVFTRRNPITYFRGVLQAFLTAMATASSAATLPITMKCLEENNNVDRRVSRFVLPIGATINMDGTALYEAVAAVFIAQSNGLVLNFGQIVTVSLTATLASVGAAAVPQAGLVTLIIVLSAVGLPTEDVSLIIAIDWLLDRVRTSVNVLGDSFGAGIIEKLSQADLMAEETDEEKMEKGADNLALSQEEAESMAM